MHMSLTFNDTIACEVISKWKAGLKEYMDVQSYVYVLSNGCKKSSDDSHNYYWEYAPVGSPEYQVICTRPVIASTGVDMLDGFDRGLQTNLQVLEAKTVKVLKVGTEHNATAALTKVVPRLKFQHCLELLCLVG
ncbi:hypothetical protein Tco_0036659 [Tanacetum coccineum]